MGAISDHKKKKFDDISKIDGVIAIFVSRANFSEILFFKLYMAISRSFLKIRSSSFLETSPFFV